MTGQELAELCEKATGPDRELDAAIAVSVLGFYVAEPRYEGAPPAYGYVDMDGSRIEPGHGGKQLIRDFTASIDAAMTLIREPFFFARLDYTNEWLCWIGERGEGWTRIATTSRGAVTPALALCAAALRARAQ